MGVGRRWCRSSRRNGKEGKWLLLRDELRKLGNGREDLLVFDGMMLVDGNRGCWGCGRIVGRGERGMSKGEVRLT